jgi:hypothetical protein
MRDGRKSRLWSNDEDAAALACRRPLYPRGFVASEANAFLTSDCEIPNCRAMRDGEMPALKAARTAFSFPDVKAVETSTCCRLRGLSPDGTFLPRRFCSASMAESNRSRSRSSSRLIALVKSFGKICRCNEVAVVARGTGGEGGSPGGKEAAGPDECENRSRVVGLLIRRMMPPSVLPGNIVAGFRAWRLHKKGAPSSGAWGSGSRAAGVSGDGVPPSLGGLL